ncbi:MAG: UPF0102 protein [Gemmatales bacterium]|nr:MAG: UPF0102 protein [Gemmatales bacterium]
MDAERTARKPWWRRWFGTRSERAAVRFLKSLNYRILARNFTCQLGELDIVALDGDCIVFVEVRSTASEDNIRPALSVNREKQRRLTRLAVFYLKRYGLLGRPARFDVVAISWPNDTKTPRIDHYLNAFDATGHFEMYY